MARTKHGLRDHRKAKGLSQENLGDRAEVPQETISRIEKRGPARAVIQAIQLARALEVSVEDLFGYLAPDSEAAPPARTEVHRTRRERARRVAA